MGTLRLKKSFCLRVFDVLITVFIDAATWGGRVHLSRLEVSLIPSPWTKAHYHAQQIVCLQIDFLVVKLAKLGNSIHNSSGIPRLIVSEKHKMLSVKSHC